MLVTLDFRYTGFEDLVLLDYTLAWALRTLFGSIERGLAGLLLTGPLVPGALKTSVRLLCLPRPI